MSKWKTVGYLVAVLAVSSLFSAMLFCGKPGRFILGIFLWALVLNNSIKK